MPPCNRCGLSMLSGVCVGDHIFELIGFRIICQGKEGMGEQNLVSNHTGHDPHCTLTYPPVNVQILQRPSLFQIPRFVPVQQSKIRKYIKGSQKRWKCGFELRHRKSPPPFPPPPGKPHICNMWPPKLLPGETNMRVHFPSRSQALLFAHNCSSGA